MISIRPCGSGDHATLRRLVASLPPLDLHTPYTYWVLTHCFRGSCLLAEEEKEPVGLLTAVPAEGSALFIWQIGVLPAARGRGVGMLLLEELVKLHPATAELRCTIAPGNESSRRLFTEFAARHDTVFEAIGEMELGEILYRLHLSRS